MQNIQESTLPVGGPVGEAESESRTTGLLENGVPHAPGSRDQQPMQRFFWLDMLLVWISGGIICGFAHMCGKKIHKPSSVEFFQPGWLGFLFLFSVLVVLFANIKGLYEFPWKRSVREDMKSLAASVASAALVVGFCFYLEGVKAVSKTIFLLTAALTWIVISIWRKFIHSQSLSGVTEKRNVLIVGAGRVGRLLRAHLENNPELGYVVKGFLDRRRTVRPTDKGIGDFLGPIHQLPSIARAHFIDEIFISVPDDRHMVKEIAQYAAAAGVQVRVIPDLYDGLAMDQPIEYIGCFPTLTVNKNSIPPVALALKRLLDIVVSAIALIVLSPLLALVAVIIKMDSKGPALYASLRVGKKGTTFLCHKFRTMVANADSLRESLGHLNERDKILFKITDDPRITPVGRFLRKFSIDEVPQFWNVLKGEMSLVGPRPAACSEYANYELEYLRRLDVAPGITGLWQVEARTDPSFDSYICLDKEYVNNWSLGLDCRILWKTVGAVLAGTGQ